MGSIPPYSRSLLGSVRLTAIDLIINTTKKTGGCAETAGKLPKDTLNSKNHHHHHNHHGETYSHYQQLDSGNYNRYDTELL